MLAACDSPHVTGRVCIVVDLRYPRECPGGQDVSGFTVEELGTGLQTVTEADGAFRIETPEDLSLAVLRVAQGRTDRRMGIVSVDPQRDEIVVPVIATPVWTSYVTTMGGTDDPTRAALHASYPPPGAIIAVASVPDANQVFYNQGNAFAWAPTPPGDQTVAILALGLATQSASITITGVDDSQHVVSDLPLEANAITWVDLPLP